MLGDMESNNYKKYMAISNGKARAEERVEFLPDEEQKRFDTEFRKKCAQVKFAADIIISEKFEEVSETWKLFEAAVPKHELFNLAIQE